MFQVFPDANRDRKVFVAKVVLDEPPPELRSGMSAEVNVIAAERPGALLAPTEGLEDGSVWLVRDGRAHRQPVTVGVRDLLRAEILEGLAEGDEIVVNGTGGLAEGSRVVPAARPPDKLQPMPDVTQPQQTSL